jgi:fructose-1,6-bisphosphatase/inositol monophosphatase family enzyme
MSERLWIVTIVDPIVAIVDPIVTIVDPIDGTTNFGQVR